MIGIYLVILVSTLFFSWLSGRAAGAYSAPMRLGSLIAVLASVLASIGFCMALNAIAFWIGRAFFDLADDPYGKDVLFFAWAVTSWMGIIFVPVAITMTISEIVREREAG